MPNKATSTGIPRGDIQQSLIEAPVLNRFLALELFPGFPVPKLSGSFGVIPLEAMVSVADVKKSPRGGYNRTDWKFEDQSYKIQIYGHEEIADDDEASNYSDYFDYESVMAQRGRNVLLLQQEIRVKNSLHNTTTFPQSGNTGLAITHEWDDATNAVPIDDVQAGREGIRARSGMLPNTLQIAWQTWFDLWRSSQIRDNIKYVIGGQTPMPDNMDARRELAKQLGLQNILIGDQFYNSAKEGQTPVVSDIWSQEYATLMYIDPSQDLSRPTVGRTFYYEPSGGLFYTFQYREESVEGDVYRVKQAMQEKVIRSECAFLFSNVYTS